MVLADISMDCRKLWVDAVHREEHRRTPKEQAEKDGEFYRIPL